MRCLVGPKAGKDVDELWKLFKDIHVAAHNQAQGDVRSPPKGHQVWRDEEPTQGYGQEGLTQALRVTMKRKRRLQVLYDSLAGGRPQGVARLQKLLRSSAPSEWQPWVVNLGDLAQKLQA